MFSPHRGVLLQLSVRQDSSSSVILRALEKPYRMSFPSCLLQSHHPTEPYRAWCTLVPSSGGGRGQLSSIPPWRDQALHLHRCPGGCWGSSAMGWAPGCPPSCTFGESTSSKSHKDSFAFWHLRHFTARNSSLLSLSFHLPKAVSHKSQGLWASIKHCW